MPKVIETFVLVNDCGDGVPIQLIGRHGGLGGGRHLRFRGVNASGDTEESVEATSSPLSPLAVTVVLDHQEPQGGRAGDNFDPPDGGTCVISYYLGTDGLDSRAPWLKSAFILGHGVAVAQ